MAQLDIQGQVCKAYTRHLLHPLTEVMQIMNPIAKIMILCLNFHA
jgi:hypothetical protein